MLLSSFKTNLLNLLILLLDKMSPSNRDKRFSLFILIYFYTICKHHSPRILNPWIARVECLTKIFISDSITIWYRYQRKQQILRLHEM